MPLNKSLLWNLLRSGAAGALGASGETPRWESLRSTYRHDPRALVGVDELDVSSAEHRLARLTFRLQRGHSVNGLFLKPEGPGPFPVVVLLHALSSDKETMIRLFGSPLAQRGIASLALDAHLHGERKTHSSERLSPIQYLELARESVIEYRYALDHLMGRSDIQPDRIGLVGYSLGGMMGSLLAAVDERVRASVLMVAGDVVRTYRDQLPGVLHGALDLISPSAFVGQISPRPVLFINGERDTTVPRQAAEMLHQAARPPSEVWWVDAGHLLPAEPAARGLDWLANHLRN